MTSQRRTFSANYNTDDSGLLSGEEYFTNASENSEPNEPQMVDQQMTINTLKTKELSLSKPTPFNGKRFKSKKFLQECILYMGINKDIYDTELK
ncbi:hypothetical protein CVT25_003750 [Psilocybe cyanescens]|uniref:Uncharacterized protein n=1 Tax=Psilocybe cyanescens TaxID=93625 RepID=A0A409XIW5_PSICY|nr:hypothetical protein CVT25_003750 [Psilocybe cyanescens]